MAISARDIISTAFRDIPVPKSGDGPIIVAVSGGSDSLALLFLAKAWIEGQGRNAGGVLHAVTIDHGLRPEAAAEAGYVAGVCAGIGVLHTTLAWEGAKPAFGLPDAARRSRYALLDQFAHDIGTETILTGHTLDDQAETVFMRMMRPAGEGDGRGLAGMARKTWLYGGTCIHRPLLSISRQTLRDYLAGFPQGWIEDPTNLDESYERVRVRTLLRSNPSLAAKALALADVSGRMRNVMARDCADWLDLNTNVEPGPVYEIRAAARLALEGSGPARISPVAEHAIQVLVALAGGREHMVPRRRLRPLYDMLTIPGPGRMTIGGAVIEKQASKIAFYREVRNLGSLLLEPGEAAIWDGRLHLFNESPSPVFVEPAKRDIIKAHEDETGRRLMAKPRQALRSTPVIHSQTGGETGQALCFPLVENTGVPKGLSVRLASPAIEHFCPQFDAPLRDWVRSLDPHVSASLQP